MLSITKIPLNQVQGASGAVCSSIIIGDFTQRYMGIRSGMRIEVLKELFAGNLQYGLLAHLRMDVQVAQPKSFAVLKGIKP
jgi:HK97 family phage major capsid protein